MRKSHHHSTLSAELLQKYHDGTLSVSEQASLAAQRSEDPFVADALDGIDASAGDTFADDVVVLRQRLRERTRQSVGWPVYLMRAAAVLLLLSASYVLYTLVFDLDANPVAEQKVARDASVATTAPLARQPVRNQNLLNELPDALALVQPPPKSNVDNEVEAEADLEETMPYEPSQTPEPVEQEVLMDASEAYKTAKSPRPLSSPQLKRRHQPSGLMAGQVVDEDDRQPLPGVNVLIEGTETGTVTDIDGRFSLPVPSDSVVLMFSSVGYASRTVTAKQAKASVALSPDVSALSEVVVTEYGSRRSRAQEPSKVTARPIDGMGQFKKYLREKAQYSNDQPDTGKKTVAVTFTVQANGQLSDFKIEKSGGKALDQEAIRLIRQGPAWQAAAIGLQKIPDQVTVKVRFKR